MTDLESESRHAEKQKKQLEELKHQIELARKLLAALASPLRDLEELLGPLKDKREA